MHSQNNEEYIIKQFFGNHIGSFLDMGANDGKTLSNTYALAINGWQGTLVEASPLAYKRLLDTHANNQSLDFIQAAVGSYNGEIVLYESGEHLGKGDTSLLSTVVPGEMERWVGEKYNAVAVPCITFETMVGLTKHKTFDFITMDIEGMELEVLPQMDLKKLKCKLICVEYNGKEQHRYDEIIIPQGFRLIHKNGENLLYAQEN